MKSNIFGISPRPYPYFWTRDAAFKQGYLVSLREQHGELLDALGFRIQIDMTSRAYRRYVETTSASSLVGHNEAYRLRTILSALVESVKKKRDHRRTVSGRQVIRFKCVLPNASQARRCRLVAVVEKDDDDNPVITLKELEYANRENTLAPHSTH
jgi:hypothetical protein